ncbi:terpenoid synthase [Sistotremastrum niveocremeum HHB9708]|uniref:Terpene synthase n=1 Tax=Sistotremastrum niveocremeum HHB9708 TaxID=1314777 RepID=A0A164T8D2_9AGAM|nr:terpenoid synthase [Sistotremastrum niveocremeum HHB9708]
MVVQLPDFPKGWPWPRLRNDHFEEAAAACTEWLKDSVFDPKDVEVARRGYNFGFTLAALAYPTLDKGTWTISFHILSALFMIDDFTDGEKGSEARSTAQTILDVFAEPYNQRPKDDEYVAEVTRQYWLSAIGISPPWQQERGLRHFEEYLDATVLEASDRELGYVRDFEDFLQIRRKTSGILPSFWIIECAQHLPEDIVKHETIVTLTTCAMDLIIYDNVKHAVGSTHNSIAIAAHNFGFPIQEAIDWIAGRREGVARKFFEIRDEVPSWGADLDKQVAGYIDGLGYWIRGNFEWCLETDRYFSKEQLQRIEATGTVEIRPPVSSSGTK